MAEGAGGDVTDDDALPLRPGDPIRLRTPSWDPNRLRRDRFVGARVERRVGTTLPVRIIGEDRFRFVLREVDWDAG